MLVHRNLTKTEYLLGARCPKSLQMKLKNPERSANFGVERDFNEFEEAYALSKAYYSDCVTVSADNLEGAIEKTRLLVESGQKTIADAVFQTESNEVCRVRLMHMNASNAYDIYDIQLRRPDEAGKEKKLKVDGAAYIYQILKRCGLALGNMYIMHINYDFVRAGKINPKDYFSLFDITERVYELQPSVVENIEKCWNVIHSAAEIERERDYMCIQPKADACEFNCHCFSDIPEDSILNVTRLQPKKALPLIEDGIVTIKDIADADPKVTKLSELQKQQVETEAYDLTPFVDVLNLRDFLSTLTYPIYHLDFETYNEPVPQYDGEHPWDQVPFQFSLHVQNEKGAEPEHYEFLAEVGCDPRYELAQALCTYIPMNACVTAYHMSFEKGRLTELAELYPDLAEHLLNIRDNIRDLEVPFAKRYYYRKEFEGKSSIKKVLPALCPGDPELDYSSLIGVHKGDEASQAFKDMQHQIPEKRAETRSQLLKYCRLDTLAMVKVLDCLYNILDHELGKDRAA